MSELLAISLGTARSWSKREPWRLPPRAVIPGSPRMWRFSPATVKAWLSGEIPPAQPPVVLRRGRPRG
ncbi:hypothetical protein JKG47_14355 [Acidithiobacillus sp. MC6.1]|nr:hypothetical protein [Acidithiobacillus sp. MC6.1]